MTETNMITSNPTRASACRLGRLAAAGRRDCASPIRRPARPFAHGEIGMIEVRGPNVFKGYWRMPEKTKAEFRDDGFFITGDLGKIDARRLRPHRRTRQGPHDHRRLQRLSERDRDRDRRDARRRRKRGDRRARIRISARASPPSSSSSRARPSTSATCSTALEAGSRSSSCRKRVIFVDDAAPQHHGQGAEEHAARALQGYLRDEEDGVSCASPPAQVLDCHPGIHCRDPSFNE